MKARWIDVCRHPQDGNAWTYNAESTRDRYVCLRPPDP